MSRELNSDALGIVTKALGLTGAGSQGTEFSDGVLDQVLDVSALIRRGRTQAATQGIYAPILRNIHSAANSVASLETPYSIAVGRLAPYPNPVPAQFDVWLLGATLRRISGSGTLSAVLTLQNDPVVQGWGIDSAGAAVVVTAEQVVAFWDAIGTEGTVFGILNQLGTYQRIGIRLPRTDSTQLTFRSTSSAAATFDCQMQLGVFPVGLGQDGLV